MGKNTFCYIICLFFLACTTGGENPAPQETNQKVKPPKPSSQFKTPLSERTSWQKPELVLDKLGDLSNKVVADVGAGTGYFSFQLLYHASKVIAVDIDPDMITLMEAFKSTLPEDRKPHIDIRIAKPHDPNLDDGEVDLALFVNVVPYISNRSDYMRRLKSELKPGGSIVIVDWKVRRLPVEAPPYDERVQMHVIEEELFEAGFEQVEIDDQTLDFQYIITAR